MTRIDAFNGGFDRFRQRFRRNPASDKYLNPNKQFEELGTFGTRSNLVYLSHGPNIALHLFLCQELF